MEDEMPVSEPESYSAKRGFLEKLKLYKEFIMIILLFVSGAMWIYGSFATKNEVDRLECFTNLNITLIQSKQEMARQWTEFKRREAQLNSPGQNSGILLEGREFIERAKLEAKQLYERNFKKYHESLESLKEAKCNKL